MKSASMAPADSRLYDYLFIMHQHDMVLDFVHMSLVLGHLSPNLAKRTSAWHSSVFFLRVECVGISCSSSCSRFEFPLSLLLLLFLLIEVGCWTDLLFELLDDSCLCIIDNSHIDRSIYATFMARIVSNTVLLDCFVRVFESRSAIFFLKCHGFTGLVA